MWWDAALRSGQTFDEVIEKELRAAKAVVVLWSPRSVVSRWVRAEATLADRRNKLVPAIIEACDRPIIFELTHAADLADWTGDLSDSRWQTLVQDLRRLVQGEGKDEETAQPLAAKPVAQPKSSPVAPTIPRPADRGGAGEKSLPPANVDDLMFAPVRLSDGQVPAQLIEPTHQEVDQDKFYKRSDEFRSGGGDAVHCLQMVDREGPETQFAVTASGLRIGRSAPADVIVAGSGVSRAHCLVELIDNQVRVSDLNSTNGTYIDDKRIGRTAILAVGSVLRVGNVAFDYEIRPREEVEWRGNAASINRGPNPRAARLARSS